MEKRPLGKTGLTVTALGFGGAEIGFESASQSQVQELLDSALDAGLNVIDTAECYAASEELIGKAVAKRRKEFHLFTKCGHAQGYDDPDWHDRKRLERSLDRSLKRLKTDYVDLFQIHSCSLEVLKQGEVIDFMQRAKQAGKTRLIGYSGDNEAAHYAVTSGYFDTLQISLNIADQNALAFTIPEAHRRGMGLIAKRPIANAVWRYATRPEGYSAPYWDRLQQLDYEWLKGPLSTTIALALRFTLTMAEIATAIVGTTKPGRWQENAQHVAQGPLEQDLLNQIRQRWKERAKSDWLGEI